MIGWPAQEVHFWPIILTKSSVFTTSLWWVSLTHRINSQYIEEQSAIYIKVKIIIDKFSPGEEIVSSRK